MHPVARKLRVASLLSGAYVPGSMESDGYAEIGGERVSRVHVVGRIAEGTGGLMLDDGSGTIRITALAGGPGITPGLAKGDLVRVIGKILEDGKGRLILAEIVKKLANPNYEVLWRLEASGAPSKGSEKAVDDLGAL